MTYDNLNDYVWNRLPTVQRTVVGRRIVSRIVRNAINGWPIAVLDQCDAGQSEIVAKHYSRTVERSVKQNVQMGFIATIVLGAIVSEIVKVLVRWWLANLENRQSMRLIVREVRHRD